MSPVDPVQPQRPLSTVPPGAPPPPPQPQPPTGRWRRWWVVPIVAVGVLALLLVVALLVRGVTGESGGAADPTAAVRDLANAVGAEDPAAALAVVDPREAKSVTKIWKTVNDGMRGAGAVRDDGGLRGVDVAVGDLGLESEDLGHGVARVRITSGTITARAIGKELPRGIGVRRDSSSSYDLRQATSDSAQELFVMAREDRGRWFVSPALTGLQYLVDAEGLPAPDFSQLEAESPEAKDLPQNGEQLLQEVANVVNTQNVSRGIELVAADEAGVLAAYRSALEALVSRIDGSVSLQLDNVDLEERSGDGDLVRLDLASAQVGVSVQSSSDSDSGSGRINGLCMSDDDGDSSCQEGVRRVLGIDRFFAVAEKRDGGLRLAPMATVLAYADALVDHLGPEGLRRAAGVPPESSGELKSGAMVKGKLNGAGIASHEYEGRKGEVVAIDSDVNVGIDGPGDRSPSVLGWQGETGVVRLPVTGRYVLAVTRPEYRSADYRIGLRTLEATKAVVPGRVEAEVPEVGRAVLFTVPTDGTAVSFTSSAAVSAGFTKRVGTAQFERRDEPTLFPYGAPATSDEEGLSSSLSFSGPASAQIWDDVAYGDYDLVVFGKPGTRFTGSLDLSDTTDPWE